MSEMLERMIRKIEAEAVLGEPMISLTSGDAERIARAILAIIREPTEQMLKAAYTACHHLEPGGWGWLDSDHGKAWHAMIDAAL